MQIFFGIYTVLVGLIFGSFASVWISRSHDKIPGIINGKSACTHCNHKLHFWDLFPVFSYLFLKGKCRYCKTKIPLIYPTLELVMALGFLGIYLLGLGLIQTILLCVVYFLSVVVAFYDIKYREIPEKTLLGLNIILTSYLVITFISYTGILPTYDINSLDAINSWLPIVGSVFSLILLYSIIFLEMKAIYDVGIFILIFLIFYLLYSKGYSLTNIPPISGILAATLVYLFFYLQILISKGRWMGGGDLRMAITLGLIAGLHYILPSLFITYLSGSIIGILYLLWQKIYKSNITDNALPFGPFLLIGGWGAIFFGNHYDFLINFILHT